MLVCTAAQMRELDRTTIEDFGLPGIVLMECAGRGVVEVIDEAIAELAGARVVVLCGSGNNGGDGFVVARHLINRGAKATVLLVADRARVSGDARTNLDILTKMGGEIREVRDEHQLAECESMFLHADVVVDALLGTGLTSEVVGQYRHVLGRANRTRALKVAVDIPSGLCADTGQVLGVAFDADLTVTFGYPKVGLVTHPGVSRVGELHVIDIGIPDAAVEKHEFAAEILEPEQVGRWLQKRPEWGYKEIYGHLLIIGGAPGMTGLAALCGEAALRCGAGRCTVAAPQEAISALECKAREVMVAKLCGDVNELGDGEGIFARVCQLLEGKTAVVLGPGLPDAPGWRAFIRRLIAESTVPLVVDGAALDELAQDLSCLGQASAPIVLTPHPGEMARLTGRTVDDLQNDRLQAAKAFAEQHGVFLALKGERTVVAGPDAKAYINPTGNPGLGSGGTGGVLTGMVAGFLAQGHDPLEALGMGVYVHGAAADEVALRTGEHALLASDLVAEVGGVLRRWE